jgi:hypothetical protein
MSAGTIAAQLIEAFSAADFPRMRELLAPSESDEFWA